jgi:hypothetical protein
VAQTQPVLPDDLVNRIDQECNKHRKALVPGVGVPSWLMSVGNLVSLYLPDLIAILQAIAAGVAKVETPTLLDISMKCCEMHGFDVVPAIAKPGGPVPAPAHPVAPTVAPVAKPAGT